MQSFFPFNDLMTFTVSACALHCASSKARKSTACPERSSLMLKHVTILVALASVSAVVGCATETAPEEDTESSGQAIMTAVGEAEPDPMEVDGSCKTFYKNFCDKCKGTCNCQKGSGRLCHGLCYEVGLQ